MSLRLALLTIAFTCAIWQWLAGASAGATIADPSRVDPSRADPMVVAVIRSRPLEPYDRVVTGFQKALEGFGVRPVLVPYDLEGSSARMGPVLERLRRSPPDLVLPLGSLATGEVVRQVTDLPIVFAMVLEPEALGLPVAPGRSGRNLTGVSMDIAPARRIEALSTVLPAVRRVGALYSLESTRTVARLEAAARAKGLTLVSLQVHSEKEVPRALEALSPKVDALLALPDATLYTESSVRFILLHALRQGQPFIGLLEPFVRAGALMGLALEYEDVGRQAAELALRIHRGEAPGQIPVQEPRRTTLLLNLRTARRIGVTVPKATLERAIVVTP